ncbi:MAG: dihydrodipicolinate synthase family protein, partial [Alphaproteobacteria bacterium]|nr:dihydrodipicolinate synthase family protein [Alphaproteobacteria bacterium]
NDTGTSREEDRLFAKWCVDEAQGRIGIGFSLRYPTLKDNIEMAKFAEEAGCDTVMVSYPPNFYPTSAREVLDYTRAICAAINLAVELFPSQKYEFNFPGGFSPHLLNEMAAIENVVTMKVGVIEYAWIDQCFRLFGDKILIGHPFDEAWPIFIRKYAMQWSGSAPWQIFQTPDNPRQLHLFNLMQAGDMDEAMALYWKMDPQRKYFMAAMQSQVGQTGLYNYQMWKYMEGLVGMSGGEMRFPKLQFKKSAKARARNAALATGLEIVAE